MPYRPRFATFVGVLLTAAIATSLNGPSASADVLWLQDREHPIFGIVVAETVDELRFSQWNAATSSFVEHRFPMQSVQSLVRNYDPTRLSLLEPSRPAKYLEYAEELLPERLDPIARDLAVRLAIIAAANSSGTARDSALCMLVEASRDPVERERFTVLKYLYSTSPVELRRGGTHTEHFTEGDTALLQAVQALRRGARPEAKRLLSESDLESVLRRVTDRVTVRDLKDWTTMTQLSGRQLAELVALELRLTRANEYVVPAAGSGQWATEAQIYRLGTVGIPQFSTVCEFDPAKSVFREGIWQAANE